MISAGSSGILGVSQYGGPMMHRLFYHNFHVTSMQDWMVALLGSFTVGSCIGCLTCMKMPVTGLYEVCGGVLSGQASISSQILCCLLPLLVAGVLAYFSRCVWYLLLPAALCGFLFSFSVCAFVHTPVSYTHLDHHQQPVVGNGFKMSPWFHCKLLLG